MSSEAYETGNDPPLKKSRSLDDLVDALERATAALTQAAIAPDEQQEFERFELSSSVTSIDQTISFVAREVRVDNFTNVHVEVTNAMFGQMWVPPRATGYRIPLSGTRHVKIKVAAPPGATDASQTTGTIAVFLFTKFPTMSVAVINPNTLT